MDNQIYETTETVEKKIGKIKPSKKIAQFTARSSGINFIAKEATIEGRYISGLGLEDVVFKLTICDDDTIDFEEISDTNKTDFDTRKRYIEDILNSDTVPYNKLSVFSDYKFISVEKYSNRHIELYLAQELVKPIDRLREITNYETLSDSALFKLNSLFDDNELEEIQEEIKEDVKIVAQIDNESTTSNYMLEAAKKAKELKLQELKHKLEVTEDRINKEKFALNSLEKIISSLEEDYKLTQARIDSMVTEISLNGYSFYLSPAIESKLELDKEFVDKLLSKLPKNINGKALLQLFEESKYEFILEKDGEKVKYSELSDEIKLLLKNKSISLQLESDDSEEKLFVLSSEDWHELIKKFERAGFYRDTDLAKRLDPLYTKDNIDETLPNLGIDINQPIPTPIPLKTSDKEDELEDELSEEEMEFMDDKFLFAIYKDDTPDITNTLDNIDPEYVFVVTPYSYWKTENCVYDRHLEKILRNKFPLLKSLGQRLGEEMESTFTILDDNFDKFYSLEEILTTLSNSGLYFNLDLQDTVSAKDTQLVINEINRLGYNNII